MTEPRIRSVTLAAADPGRLAAFYRDAIGLEAMGDGALGAGGRVLLRLVSATAPAGGRPATGLFHTAFLLPDRAALGGWFDHALRGGVALQGASDHRVSEAVYLEDPEGNGIEIYADRPAAGWRDASGAIGMDTRPLDAEGLMEARAPWRGAPDGTVVGHVHLRAAGLDTAPWEAMGMEVTARLRGARFLGWDGYHHHVALNTWGGTDLPPRPEGAPGLVAIDLRPDGAPVQPADPAGLTLRAA